MEGVNGSSIEISKKLLQGEHVEVRQKEIGLRGSWHPATVVKVKHGRRVVEYDELLTPDCSRRLQESIHLSADLKNNLTSTLRLKNGTLAKPDKRGFIRPRPPSCPIPPPINWKRGLLVDAFYDSAWWEGILLDDVHYDHAESKVKVFFPEEGDELRVLLKDLRVSQEWDEDSGYWAVCGYWLFHCENGRMELGSLKQMCRARRSFSKKLWRQNRVNGLQASWMEDQRNSHSSSAPVLHKQLTVPENDSENAVQQRMTVLGEDNSLTLKDATPNQQHSQEPGARFLQSSRSPLFSQSGACFDKEKLEGNGESGQLITQQPEVDPFRDTRAGVKNKYECLACMLHSRLEQQAPLGSGCTLESCQEEAVAFVDHFHSPHAGLNLLTGKESFSEQFVGKVKHRKSAHQNKKDKLTGESRSCSRVTRSTSAWVKQQTSELPLSGLREMPNEGIQWKLLPNSSAEKAPKLDFHSLTLNSRKDDVSSTAQQAEFQSSGSVSVPLDCRPCLNFQENHPTSLQGIALRANGAVSADDCSIPQKVRIQQARLAAKKHLLNAGWKLDVRNRARGRAMKQETVYVSPSGSRFNSLAAACRGWKSHKKNSSFLGEGINKEIELLNAYLLAEDFKCLQKSNTRQAEQVNLSDGLLEGEGNTSLFMIDCKVREHPSSFVGVIKERGVKPSSSTSLLANNCAQRDTKVKKNSSSHRTEIQKKRKSEVLDVSSPPEVRRKRGRPPLQTGGTSPLKDSKNPRVRGGCRMQVLLSFPENERNLDLFKDTGEAAQFKRSTVLSWLMDKGILKENEPVSYINRKDGHVMKKGHVTREGVVCDCCKDVFTLSYFEAHAGSKLHRPSANTFLDDGRSISDCQLEACALQDAKEKEGFMDISDDTCAVCGDGGELILCDHCPSTFHADCIGLEVIPEGDWYCPRCSCGICGNNQLAGQEVDSTMCHCVQCELEYHLLCAQGHTIPTLAEAETVTWFCNRRCREIFTALRGLVGISNPMENGFSWMLLRSMKKDQGLSPSSLEDMAEHHSKLSVAHGVMQECFVPMIDPRTNINLLSQALYNRRSKVTRLNYKGFYTILLERGDEIISVATVRVHGARLAEMPLVGTRYQYRRQGMCRRLMQALEEMLKSIGVEKLILPAVPELLETWMGAFNFQQISPQESRELNKLSLMTFPGTTLLQKHLPAGSGAIKSVCLHKVSDKVDQIESPTCKSVEEFFTMARASLDSGSLDNGEALFSGSRNGSVQSFCAISKTFNHLPQSVRPFLLVDPQTPVTMEASKEYLNIFSNGGKLKNRFKSEGQLESSHWGSGDASVMSKGQQDDDIYTKVVIATTRSNRLVKSKRWVADGLKELKNAKHSKRTFASPATCSEPAVELEYGRLCETLAHSSNGHEGGQDLKNFYARTRRKIPPMSVEGTEVNEAQIGQARKRQHNSVAHSLQSNYEVDYDTMMGMVDSKSSSHNENTTGFTSCDEGLNSGTFCGNGLHVDEPSFMNDVMDELSTCPKFYSRRKKRESMHTDYTDIVSTATAAQMTEPMVQKQTFCAPNKGSLPGFGTSFKVPLRPCLTPGGVDSQGCNLHGLKHSLS